jgi:parallel beta-helix repeat protein
MPSVRGLYAIATALLILLSIFALVIDFHIVGEESKVIIVPDDYATIQEAINHASSGDIIFVRSGTYYEHVVISKGVSLVGESRGTTVIDGPGSGNVINITYPYYEVYGVYITNLTIRNGGSWYPLQEGSGIFVYRARNVNITNNIITNNWNGIVLQESRDICINDNNISSNIYRGIEVNNSENVTIIENVISKNEDGVSLHLSSSNVLKLNNISFNTLCGIWISSGSENTLIGNVVSNNTRDGLVLKGDENTIMNNIISGNGGYGICIEGCNNSIIGNVVSSNGKISEYKKIGIYLRGFGNVLISNNIIMNGEIGILTNYDSNNSFINNSVSLHSEIGIGLFSSINNTYIHNSVCSNKVGISLGTDSCGSRFIGSNIWNNSAGILISSANNNTFYHNNFINNSLQVYDRSWDRPWISPSINIWDDGYPSGGNYWSDYTGIDLYSGPFQNDTGSDGIGDTPYVVCENNVDHYPLMIPYAPPPTYALTITATVGGTTSPTPGIYTYAPGSMVQVTAIPYSNYKFDYWELDGVNVGSANPYTVLMDKNHTLKAVFSVHVVWTVYIRIDGSIDPPDAPLITYDNITYTLTDNIMSSADGIIVERGNIVVDGAGYTLQGMGSGTGIYLSGISNVTVRNFEIKGFDYGIWLNFPSSNDNTISGNNVTENNWYGIWLVGSSNNKISENNITRNGAGIRLCGSTNNTILRNNITRNHGAGIASEFSSNFNILTSNLITYNELGGIWLHYFSSNNIISENIIANNEGGIWLGHSSNNNTISGNNLIRNSKSGIELYDSSNYNTISRNNITRNMYGIYVRESLSNLIYCNNFIDNKYQAVILPSGYTNFWDNGYPSGGNHWSDYIGADLCSGPYQNETGCDGIGDTALTIDENNRDHYPLMGTFTMFDTGIRNGVAFNIDVASNSTVSDFYFNPDEGAFLRFNVTGEDGTAGFCRVTIPKSLLWVEDGQWTILVGDEPVDYTLIADENYTYLYFAYNHSTKTVQIKGTHVIPEFPSTTILPPLILATLMATIVRRKQKSLSPS